LEILPRPIGPISRRYKKGDWAMDFLLKNSNILKDSFTSNFKQVLFQRLESKGMIKDIIPSYIRSMKICFDIDPSMNHFQINKELQFLGWNDFDLDYHTLQLAIACFETEMNRA
jgi:hypothetical protein